MITYRADWVFSGHGEPIRNGILTIQDNTILEISPWKNQPIDTDLGQSLIIPGLVNAHTHLDLGALRGRLPPPQSFTDWLLQVIAYRRQAGIDEWAASIQAGIHESLRHGTVFLGDISFNGQSYDLLKETALDFIVFREVIGLNPERTSLAISLVKDWFSELSDFARSAISPHAPYSVSQLLLSQLRDHFPFAPLAMHVAESRDELLLLKTHDGPFREFLHSLGVWHPDQLFQSIDDVIDLLNDSFKSYLVHGNYLTKKQWQRLSPSTTVVYCPRTHAYFGHDPHPYLQMLNDGVSLALGTDSLASNTDLSILNECRYLWKKDRSYLTGPILMKLATHDGKTALHPKMPANFVVLPCFPTQADPWESLWNGTSPPSATCLRGKIQNFS